MSDKLSPTSPAAPSATTQSGPHQAAWTDPRLAAKSKLASATSVEVDPSLDLDAASAQLSALRNQANAAAASGDVSALQQLAVHAVALGVAAGQHAETLANGIAAKVAASGDVSPDQPTTGPGQSPDASLTALGLKPEEIARVFAGSGAAGNKPSTASAGGIASGLHQLAALNARANGVISDARSLLAAMNQAIGTAAPADDSAVAPAAGAGAQSVTLNGLSQLLDQAESALSAKVYAVGQQLVGATPSAGGDGPSAPQPGVDLKT
jgi:hypothetical protein